MRILNATEQAHYDSPPAFSSAERKRYLDVSRSVMDAAHGLRSPASRIGFLLACGQSRATRRFFPAERYHECDIAFVSRVARISPDVFSAEGYRQRTRLHHQVRILEHQGFRPFDDQAEGRLVTEISKMARVRLKPQFIFWRCADFLVEKRSQRPSARWITDLIRARLNE